MLCMYRIKEIQCSHTIMIIGFAGYSDAAYATSSSLDYLIKKFNAEKIGEFNSDDLYNYSILRPVTSIRSGEILKIEFPSLEIFHTLNNGRDIIFIKGFEPQLRWLEFMDSIIEMSRKLNVKEVYTLGSFIDYSEEVKVSVVLTDKSLKNIVENLGLGLIDYQGPCSIYTPMISRLYGEGIKALSLWAHIPYRDYALLSRIGATDWRASSKLVSSLLKVVDLRLDIKDLEEKALQVETTLKSTYHGGKFEESPKYII